MGDVGISPSPTNNFAKQIQDQVPIPIFWTYPSSKGARILSLSPLCTRSPRNLYTTPSSKGLPGTHYPLRCHLLLHNQIASPVFRRKHL